jgi:signal transduction histidine kinase
MEDTRLEADRSVVAIGKALTVAVDRRLSLLEGLAAFAAVHLDQPMLTDYFNTYAQALFSLTTGIRALQYFPPKGTELIYPKEGNKPVLGRSLDDMLHDDRPDVRSDVARAIKTRLTALSGPYELRQGGLGLVARKPLFVDGSFAGLVTIVIDIPPILEEANLLYASVWLRFALRTSSGKVFFGSGDVFGDEPRIDRVLLPEGYWELGGSPEAGWEAMIARPLAVFRSVGGILAILLAFIVYLITSRDVNLQQGIERRTAALREELAARQAAEAQVLKLNADLERRVAERTSQLKTANEELGVFAHTVSHDLKAPLRAVSGFARILGHDFGPKLDDEGRRLIGVIEEGAGKMDRLISDILAFSRAERGGRHRTRLDMAAMAMKAYQELVAPEDLPAIVLSIGSLPEAEGDPALIQQVWANLLDNAVKYTGGRARRAISVQAEEGEGWIRYLVADTGIGFDPAQESILFRPFKRLGGSEAYEGTGIGLSIVKRIVDRHGGTVGATGRPGEGATFWFTLPIGSRKEIGEEEASG